MRNTSKLKGILYKYTVTLDIDEEEQFALRLTDKHLGSQANFRAKNYSTVISKAYSHLLRKLKQEEKSTHPLHTPYKNQNDE